MTWLALEAEIAVEMRSLSLHEMAYALDLYGAGQRLESDRRRFGPNGLERVMARRVERKKRKALTDERAAALLAAGEIRALRRLESSRRAAKRGKAAR